jgi:hypothetical protein
MPSEMIQSLDWDEPHIEVEMRLMSMIQRMRINLFGRKGNAWLNMAKGLTETIRVQ